MQTDRFRHVHEKSTTSTVVQRVHSVHSGRRREMSSRGNVTLWLWVWRSMLQLYLHGGFQNVRLSNTI